jgi:hypothetical protein
MPIQRQAAQRQAACHCGQLRVRIEGDPALVSSCHCLACQRRTGAVFASNAFFKRSQVVAIDGEYRSWRRAGDSGQFLTFHFCPTCGSTVFWDADRDPDLVTVAVGTLADPSFPAPSRTIWTENRHDWLSFPESIPPHPKSPP